MISGERRRGWGGEGGLITKGELNRGFTVFSNTPYEKSAYHYIAVGVIRHLHLNADLSFLLKCTEFLENKKLFQILG